MALKTFTVNLNGGDAVSADNNLTYKVYGETDGYTTPIATLGSHVTDSRVVVAAGVATLSGVEVGAETRFKITTTDEALNESELSTETILPATPEITDVVDPTDQIDMANAIFANNRGTVGGTGTLEDPYDVKSGFDAVENGKTLYLRGGTYALSGSFPMLYAGPYGGGYAGPAPTESSFRTIKNFPNEIPILDAANVFWRNNDIDNGNGVWVEGVISVVTTDQSYTVIDGIHIKNVLSYDPTNIITFNKCGMNTANGAANVTFKNCYVYNTVSSGIYVSGDGHIIDNNEIELFTTGGMQEGITAYNSTNVTISNNYVHDIGNYNSHNNGIGIDVKNGSSGAKVFGNKLHNTKIVGIYIDARGASTNIDIYNNEVYNIDANSWPTNHGIVVADEQPDGITASENIKVFNNIIYNTGANGIAIGWTSFNGEYFNNCQFVNNTIYDTVSGISLYTTSVDGGTTPNPSTDIYIANNIMYNQSGNSIASVGVVEYSSYIVDTNVMDSSPVGLTVTNQLNIDPLFTDAVNNDFTLQATSTAINAGKLHPTIYEPSIDYLGNARVRDINIDLGAYETQSGVSYGDDLLLIGDFASGDFSGWDGFYNPSGAGTMEVISEQFSFNTTDNDSLTQNSILTVGILHEIRYEVVSYTRGDPKIGESTNTIQKSPGYYRLQYTPTVSNFYLYTGVFGVGGQAILDNITIRTVT